MAYFNFDLAFKKGINPKDIILLQIIKQNRSEPMSAFIAMMMDDETLESLEEDGLVEYVKGTKKQTQFEKMRLSKKGIKLLEDCQTPEVNEDDLRIAEWLKQMYLQEGREVGNFKKTKMYIALFRNHSGVERNALAYLCKAFIEDEKSFEYSRKLEFLFWKPSHNYDTKFDLEESKLYQFYLKNKDYMDNKFLKL